MSEALTTGTLGAGGVRTSEDESATEHLGARLGAEVGPDGVVLLKGDLGAGKTVLARGLGRAVGVDPGEIQSPSYALIHEHEGARGRFVHVDLYRLDPEDTEALGLDELLAGPGIKAIEWPERLPIEPANAWTVTIERVGSGARRLEIKGPVQS